jgi:uncharacterized membrane protein YozB (DUF420 family)
MFLYEYIYNSFLIKALAIDTNGLFKAIYFIILGLILLNDDFFPLAFLS